MIINNKPLGTVEFIMLMALMTSLIALSIDSILPALELIGQDLNVDQKNDTQLIIIVLFSGLAFGQFFYGPIADSIGRKPTILIGLSIFFIGSLLSIFADSLMLMLIGRFLQGIGVASPRIVSMAIIRDCFNGSEMARIMSYMMSIFILVPIIAPTFGFWIMTLTHWRMIFVFTVILSVVVLAWFYIRQQETLTKKNTHPLNLKQIVKNTKTVLSNKTAMTYTLINGLIFGAFLAYLSASQHIFQVIYDTGDHFSYYFAALAVSFGVASLFNAKLVDRFGMRPITQITLISMIVLNGLFLFITFFLGHTLNLFYGMLYFTILFFMVGFLFGNLNALAMEPLGKLAGIGAGVVGSFGMLISIPLGSFIGTAIQTSLNNFILGFFICSILSLIIMQREKN